MLFISRRRMRCLCVVVLLFFISPVFAANSKQKSVDVTRAKAVTIIMVAVTESASDVFDGISKRAVIHRELTTWQKNKTFSRNVSLLVFGQAGQNKCSAPNLVSGNNNYALKVIQQSRPVGQLSSLGMIKEVVKKYSAKKTPVNLVLIGLGKNICDVDICQKVATLDFGNIKPYVLGMDLNNREKAAMQCLTRKAGGVFLNAKNIAHLKIAIQDLFQRLVLRTKQKPAVISIKIPETVKSAKGFKVTWTGTGSKFDRIILRSMDGKIAYSYIYPFAQHDNKKTIKRKSKKSRHKKNQNHSATIMAPSQTGQYRISYVSVIKNKEIVSKVLTVVKPLARLDTLLSATAGSKIRIQWSGPADRYDQIRIVAKSDPDKPLAYNYVSASKNGVLFLYLPSAPGVYEIHYLGKDDKILANNAIVALPASVTLELPEAVVAGVPFQISWRAPMNQYDRIRILSIESPDKPLAYIYAASYPKSMATITAPRKSGSYVLQYIASDKTILAHRVFRVNAAKVSLELRSAVVAGRSLRVKWEGDINQYDQIQIVNLMKKGSPRKKRKAYSRTYAGYYRNGMANLEAPEKEGLYEVIYITRDKVVLAHQSLEVVGAKASIKPLAPVTAGTKFKVAWSGPANRYDRIRITRNMKNCLAKSRRSHSRNIRRLNKLNSVSYAYVNMHANRAISFTAPHATGEYEVQYLTRNNKCLARTRLLVKAGPAK